MNANELTDEEITAIWYEPTLRYDPVAFARAILRKAQEKTTQSVMSENCTCYKLGYSQLNNYRKVNNENNNEAA